MDAMHTAMGTMATVIMAMEATAITVVKKRKSKRDETYQITFNVHDDADNGYHC